MKAINDQIVWKVIGFLWLDCVEQDEEQGEDAHNNQVRDCSYIISKILCFNVDVLLIIFSFVQLNFDSDKNVRGDAEKLQNRDCVV